MSNKAYWASGLTGGTAGMLDAIAYAGLTNGDVAVVMTDSGIYHYYFDSSSSASESSPDIITPDDQSGNGRWLLIPITFAKEFATAYISSSQTLSSWTIYHVTSGSAYSIYTPSNPRDGDKVGIIDETDAWETYNLTVDGTDTATVMGAATLVCDQPGMFFLEYKEADDDWRFSL